VVKASTLQLVGLGMIPLLYLRLKKNLVLIFTASLVDISHLRDTAKINLASVLTISLGKVINGMPQLLNDY